MSKLKPHSTSENTQSFINKIIRRIMNTMTVIAITFAADPHTFIFSLFGGVIPNANILLNNKIITSMINPILAPKFPSSAQNPAIIPYHDGYAVAILKRKNEKVPRHLLKNREVITNNNVKLQGYTKTFAMAQDLCLSLTESQFSGYLLNIQTASTPSQQQLLHTITKKAEKIYGTTMAQSTFIKSKWALVDLKEFATFNLSQSEYVAYRSIMTIQGLTYEFNPVPPAQGFSDSEKLKKHLTDTKKYTKLDLNYYDTVINNNNPEVLPAWRHQALQNTGLQYLAHISEPPTNRPLGWAIRPLKTGGYIAQNDVLHNGRVITKTLALPEDSKQPWIAQSSQELESILKSLNIIPKIFAHQVPSTLSPINTLQITPKPYNPTQSRHR